MYEQGEDERRRFSTSLLGFLSEARELHQSEPSTTQSGMLISGNHVEVKSNP